VRQPRVTLTRRRPRPGRRRDASDDAAARHVDAAMQVQGHARRWRHMTCTAAGDVGRRCVLSGFAGGVFPSGEGLKKNASTCCAPDLAISQGTVQVWQRLTKHLLPPS